MTATTNLSLCFDLDGTLVDTAPDLIRVLDIILKEESLPPTDYKSARKAAGRGVNALITEAFARAGHTASLERISELTRLFFDLYEYDIARLSRPFSGVVPTLRKLRAEGYRLSVSTNKPRHLARPLMDELGMTALFDKIVAPEDVRQKKPSPEHIFAAAGHRQSQNIVMIGDSPVDVRAARAAHIPVILFSYGYAEVPASSLRADRVLRHFWDLPLALKSLKSDRKPKTPYP